MASRRPFNFYPGTSIKTQMRQHGRCACCASSLADELDDGAFVYAHHVVPNQCGNPADPTHKWLKTELNCVVLCHMCHMRVHQDGNTRSGAVAPPEYFPLSHRKPSSHASWAKEVNRRAALIWAYVESKHAEVP